MTKQKAQVAKFRKVITSVIVIAIFLLPAFLTINWAYGVFGGKDHRKTLTDQPANNDSQTNGKDLKPFDEPIITITFDDGWESAYSEGLPILNKYGLKTTQYVLGDQFKDPQYMSEAQIRSLVAGGHEIGAHTMSHSDLTTLTEDKLTWELSEPDRRLSALTGYDIKEFATPLGASNNTVVAHTQKYYRSLRNTDVDPAIVGDEDLNLPGFNPNNINAYTVRDTTTIEDLQKLIDYTIKRKGWLVLTYHQVGDHPSHWAVSQQALDTQMKLVKDSRIRSATMGQVLNAIDAAKEKKRGT